MSVISARSHQYLARDRFHLVPISAKLKISPSSWRDLDEISFISPRPQSHYKSRPVIGEILAKSRVSRRALRDITNLGEISSRLTRSRRDLCHLGEISLISPRYRRDLCDNTNLSEISVKFFAREHAWDWSSQAESQIVRIPLQSFIPCLFALLLAVKLKPESISQGDRELIVNMTILETWDV